MLVVFQDLGLEKYIAKDAKALESADAEKLTVSEINGLKEMGKHIPELGLQSEIPR